VRAHPRFKIALRGLLASAGLGMLAIGTANVWVLAHGRLHATPAHRTGDAVAIVPGARVENRQPLYILEHRLQAALDLHASGRVETILVSGNDTEGAPEVSVMSAWLRARGVPRDHILTDPRGFRTRETMVRAAGVFGVKRAIVCTETLSMPRSLYLARSAGIDADGVALPTVLARAPRWLAREALKNVLAFAESELGAPFERPRETLAER
jgi:SanA protein